MALTQDIHVDLIEKELIKIELSTIDVIPRKTYITELTDVQITQAQNGDILVFENGYWIDKPFSEIQLQLVHNETPTAVNPLPSAIFETAYDIITGSLRVFLNGQKLHASEITEISLRQFSFPIDVISTDMVEVSYAKL